MTFSLKRHKVLEFYDVEIWEVKKELLAVCSKNENNNSEENKKMEEKEISKQETTIVKYTTYLPKELITKVKI